MDAYSQDLRERVARACDSGEMSQPEVAEAFGVSLSFITKLLRRRRNTGSLAALPHARGPKPLIQSPQQTYLKELVQAQPDATLAELCERLADRASVRVSPTTMCRALAKLDLRRKKRAFMPPNVIRRGFRSSGGPLSGKWQRFRQGNW
jgi:transposase